MWSFTRHPNVVTALAIPVWLLRLALCLWLVMTIQAEDNVLGAVCAVSMNFELATIMQYIKILSECIILFFFLEQIVSLHRGSRGLNIDMDCRNNNHWRHLGVINSAITFMVILSEVYVGVVTIRQQDYLLVTYSMVNLYQATLVVCIVEDTRTTFKKRAQGCDVGQQDARSDRVAYFDGIAIGQLSSSAPFRHSYMAQRGEINRTNNIHHRHSMPVPKLARYALAESPGLPISCLSPIHGEGGGGIDVGADHGHSLPAVALVRERSLSSSHRVPVSMGIRAEEQQDTMVKATCSQID
ncbi:hypothetical protein BG004_000447 [Podila humilis]|nr:hypothetical protein BG004_000447 [Podila humilis]